MTAYTADDFAKVRFATRNTTPLECRAVAHSGRDGQADRWIVDCSDYPRSDDEMARDGWVPVQERPLTPDAITAREHLDAAWEAAHVPADGAIPAGAEYIMRSYRTGRISTPAYRKACVDVPAKQVTHEFRLLDPPTPARPEGAERWEDFLIDSLDYQALTDQQIANLADRIAEETNR